ncbi:MAG: archaemetzincin family Zn-dependent metalloprotease [Nitrospirota bacterium]
MIVSSSAREQLPISFSSEETAPRQAKKPDTRILLVNTCDLPDPLADEMELLIGQVFRAETTVLKAPSPRASTSPDRQYPAREFLQHLRSFAAENTLVAAIADPDLSFPGLNFVFGLSDHENGVAVVSMHRFLGKNNVAQSGRRAFERTLKTAVHELGHLHGLSHCNDQKCAMFFSFTVADTDYKEQHFCRRCAEKLHG